MTLSALSPLFVDGFGHSLQFCDIEFYKEGISADFSEGGFDFK